jgi:signal transduction histidine kinase
MKELIEDLLQLARTEEQLGDTEPVNLEELSKNCWQNVETANATIQINSDTTILADQSQLAQVLENLMGNAIEHTEQDATITVGELADGFYVEDDRNGIPEDERDSVFEAGYTTVEQGTGFGLSIVEEVIKTHGWSLHLTESSEGGARFEITNVDVDMERVGGGGVATQVKGTGRVLGL